MPPSIDPIHAFSIVARALGVCLFVAAVAMAWNSCRYHR